MVKNMVKTTVSVFTCAYCGSTMIKKGESSCSYCGSTLDWNNTVSEPDPVIPVPLNGKSPGGFVAYETPKSAGMIIVPSPTFSLDWNRGMIDKALKEGIAGKTDGSCQVPVQKYPVDKKEALRKLYDEKMRKIYNISEIIVLGVTQPFEMKKRPEYVKKFPNATNYFTSRIIWMFADGKDLNVKMSWLWLKNEADIQDHVKCLFKVCEADVSQRESNGKTIWTVARRTIRPKRDLSTDEVFAILPKIKGQVGTTVDEMIDEDVKPVQEYELGGCWKAFDAMCLSSREISFGRIFKIADVFSDKVASALSPNFLGNDVNPGDTVLVTGYIYKSRAFDKNDLKNLRGEKENKFSITGIKSIEKAGIVDEPF